MADSGPEPEFRADGYVIRITGSTAVSFQTPLRDMSDVRSNVWVEYEGTRDKSGVLEATSVRFLRPKPAKFKAMKGVEVSSLEFDPPQSALCGIDDKCAAPAASRIRFGSLSRWHTVSSDQVLQARVQRIGKRLIPSYQKALPAGDPSKVDFGFYAVDWPSAHEPICSLDGLVLVSTELLARLRTDDEIAAILADGIAYHLQRQAAKIVVDNRMLLGMEGAANMAALTAVPFIGLPATIGMGVEANALNRELEEQRSRVALGLLADAGYDPWQAPEAWRLAQPRRLPKDLSALKFPERSGYQLSILHLQYKGAASPIQAQSAIAPE